MRAIPMTRRYATTPANTPDNLKRLRNLIVSIPLAVGLGYALYRRLILGIEQKHFSDMEGKTIQDATLGNQRRPS
ncbi:hypothetical protein BD324DRAFT_650819 [Kockovaella imperatae]|uniref:Uncharacterized protein n=1 Tax=Kockovaella imperatae TaxID=4999 RepID=A0A1Y1UGM6_9TREE|nr:hypothetical protein BD324DRAFT_650819 [Kockovaella imperatae]ORX37213.1 hypothetical protein BD324DRAFT_650819 [Kockovaella imperatae]